MKFNKHLDFEGQHAFLGASKYHWVNYTNERLINAYNSFLAIQRGTDLHEFASHCIKLGIKLPSNKKSLNSFVNDSIGFKMKSEQILYYSENAFGTADSISFSKQDKILKIFDLKTGKIPASAKQLYIYDALFCLEYNKSPLDIQIENRIYQNDEINLFVPEPQEIRDIMTKIIEFDKILSKIKEEDYNE